MQRSDTLGILAGLSTAVLWTVTAVCFEAATRRIGSLAVNILRLLVATILFSGLSLVRAGSLLPMGLSGDAWFYLGLSGVIGFVVGDLLLFQAFMLIGARLSMLIYAGTPILTSMAGFLILGERMSPRDLLGMGVGVAGIALAVMAKPAGEPRAHARAARTRGVLCAIGGTAGQAAGLLLGKRGASNLDSFTGTQIRALFGLAGFGIVVLLARQGRAIVILFPKLLGGDERHSVRRAFLVLGLGAILGPFLGVSLGLLATQRLPTGTAATLMSLVPVLLIPVSALAFKEKAGVREIVGAILAVGGVALLAW